jgi:aspartyl-tRNA(Asn)/glutamyl-tRNA(Gln) amidotransferase subunit B
LRDYGKLKSLNWVARLYRNCGWDDDRQVTFSQRSKEDAHDHRYFPDADIPPVVITSEQIDDIRSNMPKLPSQYRREWGEIGLESSSMNALLARKHFAELVSEVLQLVAVMLRE